MEKKNFILKQLESLEKRKNNGATDRELGFLLEGYICASESEDEDVKDVLEVLRMIKKDLKNNKENINIIEKYKVYCLTM
jgi:ligand-binding sensor protein